MEKRKRLPHLQQGHCSYTFILPELGARPDPWPPAEGAGALHGAQRDAPSAERDGPPPVRRVSPEKLQHLESAMRNTSQWLQKVGDAGPWLWSLVPSPLPHSQCAVNLNRIRPV